MLEISVAKPADGQTYRKQRLAFCGMNCWVVVYMCLGKTTVLFPLTVLVPLAEENTCDSTTSRLCGTPERAR